jgi:hypothetical protein
MLIIQSRVLIQHFIKRIKHHFSAVKEFFCFSLIALPVEKELNLLFLCSFSYGYLE